MTIPVTFVAGTRANAADVNEDMQDIADALTDSLPRDGQAGMTGQMLAIDGAAAAPGIAFDSDPSTGFRRNGPGDIVIVCSGTDVVEITTSGMTIGGISQTALVGEVKDYAGSSIPNGWFVCDGSAKSRSGFALLFAALGTAWGSGNGTTTFNIPDLQGRLTAGLDGGTNRLTTAGGGVDGATLGAVGGTQSITLDTTMIPAHTHANTATGTVNRTGILVTNGVLDVSAASNQKLDPTGAVDNPSVTVTMTNASAGGGLAHMNVQPTAMVNKIIFAGVATV